MPPKPSLGKTRVGLWVGILGPQFLVLVTYLTVRQTKNIRLILGDLWLFMGNNGVT